MPRRRPRHRQLDRRGTAPAGTRYLIRERSERAELSFVKFVIGGAHRTKVQADSKGPALCSLCKARPKVRHPRSCHGYSACRKNRPSSLAIPNRGATGWNCDESRRSMRSADAFEEQGLLAYTEPEPEITVDELGRLRKTRVNQALEDFDENLRSRVISVLEQLHACRLRFVVTCSFEPSSAKDVGLRSSVIHGNMSV